MRFMTHNESVYFTTRYPWECGDGCCSDTEYGDHIFSAMVDFELWPEYDRLYFNDGVPDHEGEYIEEWAIREAVANGKISPVDELAADWMNKS